MELELKQCINGHFYNSNLPACPRCGCSAWDRATEYQKSASFQPDDLEEYGKMQSGSSGMIPPTGPVQGFMEDEIEASDFRTRPPQEMIFEREEETPFSVRPSKAGDAQMTRPVLPEAMVNSGTGLPIVGWLVCIEGAVKGKDYKLHVGYNNIGKDSSMDVVLDHDPYVSRFKDSYIGYDMEEKLYFFGHENGKNMIRVNGKGVRGSVDLKNYDILSIGSCKYLFVALCGDWFDWE